VTDTPPSVGYDERGEPVYPPHSVVRTPSKWGVIGYRGHQIHLGSRWAGATVRVIPVGGLVHVYYGEELVRVLAIDPSVDYQASGKGVPKANAVR
jgi:hypothetical protein